MYRVVFKVSVVHITWIPQRMTNSVLSTPITRRKVRNHNVAILAIHNLVPEFWHCLFISHKTRATAVRICAERKLLALANNHERKMNTLHISSQIFCNSGMSFQMFPKASLWTWCSMMRFLGAFFPFLTSPTSNPLGWKWLKAKSIGKQSSHSV